MVEIMCPPWSRYGELIGQKWGGWGAKAPQPPRLRRACVYFHAISSYKHHCRIKSPYGYDYVTGSEMCRDQDMFQTLVFYLI